MAGVSMRDLKQRIKVMENTLSSSTSRKNTGTSAGT